MTLSIYIRNEKVLLEYMPLNGAEWIDKIFDRGDELTIKRTFKVSKSDLYELDNEVSNDTKVFIIGEAIEDFYKIYSRILSTKYDVLIHKSYNITVKTFITNNNISILASLENLANQQIIIGGDKSTSIPKKVYKTIIQSFPTNTELKHYVKSRVTNVLSQYLEGVKDSGKAFERYLEKRNKINVINSIPSIKNYEYDKYQFILEELKNMLIRSDSYAENDWQQQILEIILLLYPKYIRCLSEVKINDYYTFPGKISKRFIDLMLVDSNGSVDVIEIKKPFSSSVITQNTYRDNYTPLKELSGTIMQVEKYLFHLNKWGVAGEKSLTIRYKKQLPKNFRIRITNPKGLVILGRDNNLSKRQLFDFEIIKRKYSNIIDIITYDDLVNRLENAMNKFMIDKSGINDNNNNT